MKDILTMIRPYRPADEDAVIGIWLDASNLAHPFLDPAFLARETANMRQMYLPNAETWIYEADAAVHGFISMIGPQIAGLFIAPRSHGCGYGRALVDFVAQDRDLLKVEVFEQNAGARKFYARYGFVEIARFHHDAAQAMVLKLSMGKD